MFLSYVHLSCLDSLFFSAYFLEGIQHDDMIKGRDFRTKQQGVYQFYPHPSTTTTTTTITVYVFYVWYVPTSAHIVMRTLHTELPCAVEMHQKQIFLPFSF